MQWEWTRNEPGMTQENLMKILKFSNSGSFLGFLGILRIPEDSTRNWWGRVKTSYLPLCDKPYHPLHNCLLTRLIRTVASHNTVILPK
jgi:hypothetical protein